MTGNLAKLSGSETLAPRHPPETVGVSLLPTSFLAWNRCNTVTYCCTSLEFSMLMRYLEAPRA